MTSYYLKGDGSFDPSAPEVLSPAPPPAAALVVDPEAPSPAVAASAAPANYEALRIAQRPIFKEFLSLLERMLPAERAYACRYLQANVQDPPGPE
jgi:hypothetical protein